MPLVIISRGSYTRGRKVAEELAQRTKFELVSREVLVEASETFNIPEVKLERALHDAPSVLERFTHGKKKYIAYIQNAILQHMVNDNVIYHGLAGQAFMPKVHHLLRVRIRADIEDRVKEEMKRENIAEDKARYILTKDDDERRKWSISVTGHDPSDPSQYDLIFNASSIPVDGVVDILEQIVKQPYMQATPESQQIVEDLARASEIKVRLVNKYPEVQVRVSGQTAVIIITGSTSQEQSLSKELQRDLQDMQVIKEVKVQVVPDVSMAYFSE